MSDEDPARERGSASEDSPNGDGAAPIELSVPEMDCPSCATTVTERVEAVEGVAGVDARPTTGTLRVEADPDGVAREDVVDAVEGAGYGVEDEGASGVGPGGDESIWTSRRAVATWAAASLLLAGLVATWAVPPAAAAVDVAGRTLALADLLYLAAVTVGGRVILRDGFDSLRTRSLDIDFLMSAAILGATGLTLAVPSENLLVEAASLAVLFNVAELLERYSVVRARRSIAELQSLAPETAVVRRDGREVEVPAAEISPGETVLVRPGGKVPVDGTVTGGESAVDQATITGESVPVDKQPGDEVYAGTVNEGGYLEVEATAAGADTTLSRIVELVADAEADQTDREQFVERFARYYTPAVTAAAVLTAAVPPLILGAAWTTWFVRGISLLVVACPCAFVISTPVSVVSGVTSAARNGVLVKGGSHLEAAGEVEAVAFDKTGTLTTGDLRVTDVVPLGDNDEADVLRCARGLEERSEHPIGEAIVARADEAATDAAPAAGADRSVSGFESLTSEGVRADLDGTTHYAGAPSLFADLEFDLSHVHFTTESGDLPASTRAQCERERCLDLVEDTVPELRAQGKTVVLVGTEDSLEGVIAVADGVRPEAPRVVERLREAGVERLVMLTGDSEVTARAVAESVGVDEFRADLHPEEKVAALEDLRSEHGSVAMVGDGVNDAPALATADVGIAMGAAGSDSAIETADVALLSDDLTKLPYLRELSRKAGAVIRENVWTSLGVKALLAVAIPLGYVNLVVAVLAGDVGMTTLVTGNAMRLSRVRADGES